MATIKHSETPWRLLDRRDRRGNIIGWSIWQDMDRPYSDSPRGNKICETPDGSTPESKANAEFIVLACNTHDELLDACRSAYCVLSGTEMTKKYLVAALQKCQIAIANTEKLNNRRS